MSGQASAGTPAAPLSQRGLAVIELAKKDVGLFEGRSNTGGTQKFALAWNSAYPKGKLALNSPYCGLAVWYWYWKSGIDPNIKYAPRAINWKVYCDAPKSFFGLKLSELEAIPPASAVVYKNSWGNHVGLFHRSEGAWIYTYEGNTSTARAVSSFGKKGEGVFYLKTSINNKDLKPIFYCDCIKQGKAL